MSQIYINLREAATLGRTSPEYQQVTERERVMLDRLFLGYDKAADEIERLELELKEARAAILSAETEAHQNHVRAQRSEAQAAAMREALELILPMAKGYAAAHRVGSNAEYITHAESALSADAGRRVLAVVEEAENYSRTLDILESSAVEINLARVKLRQALAAMGK